MAYEPKTWVCGETITADALNHLEQGVANAGGGTEPLIGTLSVDGNDFVADVTYRQASVALNEGKAIVLKGGVEDSGNTASYRFSVVATMLIEVGETTNAVAIIPGATASGRVTDTDPDAYIKFPFSAG